MSMTPDSNQVTRIKPSLVPIRLADHSMVHATHKGDSSLPLTVSNTIKTLVVPDLHEPLLSVAAMCDSSLRIFFTPTSCNIYDAKDFKASGFLVGQGYRKGNLFYLPSAEAVAFEP